MTAAEALVARTCRHQGLPTVVDDPAVLGRVADLIRVTAPGVESEGSEKTTTGWQARGVRRAG